MLKLNEKKKKFRIIWKIVFFMFLRSFVKAIVQVGSLIGK